MKYKGTGEENLKKHTNSALRAIVCREGPIPASDTASTPICIPVPVATWATQTCAWAGSIEVYHIHTTLKLLGLAFCGLAQTSHQKASQKHEILHCHAGELTGRSARQKNVQGEGTGKGGGAERGITGRAGPREGG